MQCLLQTAEILLINNLTVSTAESCTGGLVSAALTSVPGSSGYFMMGVTTYSNQAKHDLLGVNEKTLADYGAVSSQVAEEMAVAIRKLASADYGISVTGVAGPGGGSVEKPVGLVYVGLAMKDETIVKKFNFSGSRKEIREQTVNNALQLLNDNLSNLG